MNNQFHSPLQAAKRVAENVLSLVSETPPSVKVCLDADDFPSTLVEDVLVHHHQSSQDDYELLSESPLMVMSQELESQSQSLMSSATDIGAVGGQQIHQDAGKKGVTSSDGYKEKRPSDPPTSRTSPTNPMSVSVPNLPSSTEQTASLLESFSAVLRRNRGNNNMTRSSNMSSLARLAMAANSPSKWLRQLLSKSLTPSQLERSKPLAVLAAS